MAIEVITDIKRPSQKIVGKYQTLMKKYHSITPALSDCMNRLNAMDSDIQPLFPGIRMVGVALTIKTTASDLAPVIKALEYIQLGDILVVDTHSSKNTAFWGEIVAIEAKLKGAKGIILDSAVRDIVELKAMNFPVLCRGVSPNPAGAVGFGYINVPVQCGGAAVSPGDIIVVDDNGVIIVPCYDAEKILGKTKKFLEDEEKVIERVQAGESLGQILNLDDLEQTAMDHTRIYDT